MQGIVSKANGFKINCHHSRFVFCFPDTPQIHLHVQVAKAAVGERISLNCTARGNPTPNVTWYRGTTVVERGWLFYVQRYDQVRQQFFLIPSYRLFHSPDFLPFSSLLTTSRIRARQPGGLSYLSPLTLAYKSHSGSKHDDELS